MPGIDVKMMSYGERLPASQDRYNSEDSLEDNQSTTSSTESRQSDFQRKPSDQEFIPTRTSGILSSKPAANPNQFTRVNSNPLLISAQKQMLLVEEAKKKKKEQERKQVTIGDDTPDWQSNLDGWKLKRRKQSEDAIERLTEIKRFEEDGSENGNRKSSISRKISAQYGMNDEIDFNDLNLDDDVGDCVAKETSDNDLGRSQGRSSFTNALPTRRESRGISQEKVIPEVEEEDSLTLEQSSQPVTSPYNDAIEGYRSFAKSKLNGSESRAVNVVSDDSDRGSSLSTSASTSSMSPAPVSSSARNNDSKNDDAWEEKIETFIQPARRVSSEISDKMKQKLANFEDSKSGKDQAPARLIEPDNSFKDKLKAFKTIESNVEPSKAMKPPSRRESEPSLHHVKPKGMLANYRSTSSSFMNTTHNNKFFQQNSLGSEKDDDSLSSNNQMLDDALEESFNDILEDNMKSGDTPVFSADDFIPCVGRNAPPQEKPPPLPAQPPPGPPGQHYQQQQQQSVQMENDLDKQEREIIESLEREEKEHKKHVASNPSGFETSSVVKTSVSKSQSDLQSSVGTQSVGGWRSESLSHLNNAKKEAPRKKSEITSKDYNKHWLIQEAEQRRISEAQHKHSPAAAAERMESVNGYQPGQPRQDMRAAHNTVSDNIYANVDTNNLSYPSSHSAYPDHPQQPAANIPQIPGPQVPPRLGPGQDRKLSVSGKKKCSHCSDELGRGAAMIIESLKLYYHIRCFKCCVCSILLGNGETGTDVRVRNNRLHCQNCYSNDEGLKFSKV